jgi:hypothetical protein
VSTPEVTDPLDLNGWLSRTRWPGIMDTGETDDMPIFTGEAEQDDAVVRGDVIQGSPGPDGDPADPVDLIFDDGVETADDLPKNLGESDKGKTWWIGNLLYRWDGRRYLQRPIGTPGARGVMPALNFNEIEQLPWDAESDVTPSGEPTAPDIKLSLAVPRGQRGPSCALVNMLDFGGGAPVGSDVPTWYASPGQWQPSQRAVRTPRIISIPQAAFQRVDLFEFGEVTILQYQLPAMDYAYVPWCWGHAKASGLVFSSEPFRADAVVRLRTANGPAVGHGAGNITDWSNIVPKFFVGAAPPGSTALPSHVADPQDLSPFVVAAQESVRIFIRIGQMSGTPGKMFFDPRGAQLTLMTVAVAD